MRKDRTPGLTLPFMLVGMSAGWLCVGFLSHPTVDYLPDRPQAFAAAIAGLAGAIVGALVTRSCRPREADAWRSRMSPSARMVLTVPIAGAVSGAIVGLDIWPRAQAAVAGALTGAGCAVVFLPICAVVLAAARRAARARLGTIVAATDHRAVWRTLAGCVALASLLAAPDWSAAANGVERAPAVGGGVALAAALIVAACLLADVAAVLRVAGLVARGASMEERQGLADTEAAVPRVDLGLGDDVRAEVARGAAAYRATDRAVTLLVGSLEEAVAAVRGARRRSAMVLAGVLSVLVAHAFAMSGGAAAAFAERRCADGLVPSCVRAAELHAEALDLGRALAFRTDACERGHDPSCSVAHTLRSALGMATPAEMYELGCENGDDTSCRAVARLILHRARRVTPQDLDRASGLLRRACVHGDNGACAELDGLAAQ